ncbi:hypothetical protein RJ639_031986 [Escallonia herrerae]|uniref:Copper transport protein n=1 Tax=Escallonia herrerae TaxID=1293975 RepID=A0AA88X0U1_9ASTE|nr:hypothetical protein RJ639_031986 [Escallonia herrerae]
MDMPMPMSNCSMNTMGMQMNFYWGKDVVILFHGWPDNNLGMYILSLAFVFLLAVAVEVLSVSPAVKPGSSPFARGLTQAAVYALRMAVAYLVMLSVMSYNLGIFILAVAGHALGFFFVKYRALVLAARADASNNAPKVRYYLDFPTIYWLPQQEEVPRALTMVL